MDECDITVKEIQDIYKELKESIYCIIPSSWQNNKANVYYTQINSFISNGEAELRELIQAFPVNKSKEMPVYENSYDEEQFDIQISNIKKKCECINIKIDKLVEIKSNETNNDNQSIYNIGNRAKNSVEYMVNSVEGCLKEYYAKKSKIKNGYNKSVAVIIPAYNAKKTIKRALDSIASQTLNDMIQVKTYIVNDCSIYDYQDIITEYSSALDIEEIELKENVGPGLARQNGILKCKEDFIIFLDGDDFFYNEKALEVLLVNAIDNNADCVVSYFMEESDNGRYRNSNNMGWLHGKLYRSSFIKEKKIEFLDSRATEDAAFNMLMQVNNPKIISIPDVTYVWACNDDSITRKNNYEFIYTYIESYSENIRKILELTAEKNLNMHVAMHQALNSLFVIWTDYINEIEQLKTLSFKIENEIAQVDFEFKKKISSLLGLKIARLYQEEDLELTTQNKKVKSIATHLMKEKLGQLKKILISKIKTNLKISEKENKLLDKINKIKINQELKKNKYKQYLLTNNTIFEEDENKSTEGKNNDDDSDNEKIDTKNKHSSNCLKFNNINIDFKEITEKIKTKMLRSLSNENAKRKNMQFFTNNNLHVNINLNLNIRNIKIIHRNTVA